MELGYRLRPAGCREKNSIAAAQAHSYEESGGTGKRASIINSSSSQRTLGWRIGDA
jgi:hypothetical protein